MINVFFPISGFIIQPLAIIIVHGFSAENKTYLSERV